MLIPFRQIVSFFLGAIFIATGISFAANNSTPPTAAPAFLDVVSFEFNADGENHKVVVTSAPNLLRVDEPDDGYSILYNPQTDFYTGLEHRNYTFWQFSWPEIRDAVENSKRHEARLQDLSNEGLSADTADSANSAATNAATNAPTSGSTSLSVDDSGYVWHPDTVKKRIAGLECIRWTGDTVSGENVEAWCYAGPLPKVQAAIEQLHNINEPIALVPVRNLAPDFIFPVYGALLKGGVTPLEIDWGDQQNRSYFRFLEAKTRDGKLSLFTVPKLYMKTTLVTMDGMLNAQPAAAPRNNQPAKTWQN